MNRKLIENIQVLTHSSIRITGEKNIYVDPYEISMDYKDADIICVTHSHYDHFDPKSIEKIKKDDTRLIAPETIRDEIGQANISNIEVIYVTPGDLVDVDGTKISAVHAYNINKKFHPRENMWVGYIISIDGSQIYIAGDTDITEENESVKCDIALLPIGGTYTMDQKEAAKLAKEIEPELVIPTHYGSVVGTKSDEDKFKSFVGNDIEVIIKMEKY